MIIVIDERTKKILLAIIKHCNTIENTKKHFGNDYNSFKENNKGFHIENKTSSSNDSSLQDLYRK